MWVESYASDGFSLSLIMSFYQSERGGVVLGQSSEQGGSTKDEGRCCENGKNFC